VANCVSYKFKHIAKLSTFSVEGPHALSIKQWLNVLGTLDTLWMRLALASEDCNVLSTSSFSCHILRKPIAALNVYTIGPPSPSAFDKPPDLKLICNIYGGMRSYLLLECPVHCKIKWLATEYVKVHEREQKLTGN
jgi:hypothetical protein